ncbi:MAG: hypothetical protein NZ853_08435 [Leptospiraceae bacterium]|nr:hypothetical protein [Leptospiraceae bacterium]MDW7976797.1 hypothetical protein [Leptospiraceae bacterium]
MSLIIKFNFGFFFLVFLLWNVSLQSRVFLTPEAALQEAFPNATIEKIRIYLTEQDQKQMEQELGFKIKHRFFSFYVAKSNQNLLGYAILHTDIVRTKEMSLMIVLNPKKEIQQIYLISFYEPIEYKPTERWLELFTNRSLNHPPVLGIDIPVVSGATLTARSAYEMAMLTLYLAKSL